MLWKWRKKLRAVVFARGVEALVGGTPLVEVEGVLAKLEAYNPSGSVKDRMAWHMVRRAEERGELRKGQRIIEVTSGNTGIAFSLIAAARGYRFTAVMPESMSVERRKMMLEFGAKLALTPAEEDMAGAVKKYEELVRAHPDAWLPKQFENPDNPEAQRGLGREIIEQTGGNVDAFVAGIGTGGTLIGVAQELKKANPQVKIIGVEPAESAVLNGGKQGPHGIQGIGEGFVPALVRKHLHLIDEVVAVRGDEAIAARKLLAKRHGLLVGISSGANFLAALQAKKRFGRVVTVFADRGERYLST